MKNQVKSALLAKRNIIFVGPPGVGKTTLARSIAALLGDVELSDDAFRTVPVQNQKTRVFTGEQRFIRVQGSPDLTSEDLLGDIDPIKALEFGPTSIEAFSPGKIFRANNGILFFDEVNRCSSKLQNALLQALQEKIVTIGSYDVDFSADFLFIGTMNPSDNSTEELSSVFLDRFDLIYLTYPESEDDETDIVSAQAHISSHTDKDIIRFCVRFVRSLRSHEHVEEAPGVRASIGLVERASAFARIHSRSTETKDVFSVVESVLAHRLRLKPSVRYNMTTEEFVRGIFERFLQQEKRRLGGEG